MDGGSAHWMAAARAHITRFVKPPSLLLFTLDSSLQPLPATAATAVYVPRSATYLLFRFLYLSINSSWLFLFPFLTGRKWMAARNGAKAISSIRRGSWSPFLHSCILAIWFQRTNNRSRNIDQIYPSLLVLTLDSSLLPHTAAAAAVYVPRSATYLLFRYFLPFN